VPNALSIDFETASKVDLRKTGAYRYARDPSTRVLCMSYRFDDGPVLNWRPGQPFPADVIDHVMRMRRVRGWNVGFEWLIWNYVLFWQVSVPLPRLDLAQLSDTMARAAYWGLPLSLDQAAPAAGVPFVKDKEGHALMMRMNRPRGYNRDTGDIWWHETDPAKYDRLVAYCDQDVMVESAIADALPELPETEQAYWEMDQRINARGVALDTELIDKLKELAADAKGTANQYLSELTSGAVSAVTNTAKLLAYLQALGSPLKDLTKDAVARRLDEPDCGDLEREILELRADVAKTSAAKLDTMLSASWTADGQTRVRGMLQFYGASRTGRWAGRLIQLQNMPRGTVKQIEQAIRSVLQGMDQSSLEAFFGPALGVVSSALRGCLIAASGNKLVVADFAQIEARVVAWLAGQQDILDVFARGEDVYVYTANKNGSNDRQLGKVLVLACGFGMSATKFRTTALTYKLVLSEEQADRAVRGWRRANAKIVQFWYDCELAARRVINNASAGNSEAIDVGPVKFAMWQGHLLIRLPSGRKLVYRDARIEQGRFGDTITYMGVDQYTRKWSRQSTYGGKLVENITQAVARDIMAEATHAAELAGIPVELLVHDEMIAEAPERDADDCLATLLRIMRTPPKWAPGLPVDGAGWVGDRYKK